MTNPVVLLGTQSNGETLPVQVDATGRLVAEGLPGEQGPPGPPGGSFALPADPYEGALLGWLNGGLAWIGTPPVPIPEGAFGPIVAWNANEDIVTVVGDIPGEIGPGVLLQQIDEYGNPFTEGWNVSHDWVSGATAVNAQYATSITGLFNPEMDWYSSDKQYFTAAGNTTATITFDPPINAQLVGETITQIDIAVAGKPGSDRLWVNNDQITTGWNDNEFTWINTGKTSVTSMAVKHVSGSYSTGISNIRVNGRILITPSFSLNMIVNSVTGEQIQGVPNVDKDFSVDKFLKVPAQRVAPWRLYGADPTSLIDYLRSS